MGGDFLKCRELNSTIRIIVSLAVEFFLWWVQNQELVKSLAKKSVLMF
jgi:hypothetical protein